MKKDKNHVEEVDTGKKTRIKTCGGEFEANVEFTIEERELISDAGFGCFVQPGELWNAKLEFRSFKHQEIDSARCERKRIFNFSSVASKWDSSSKHREIDGESTKSTHRDKVDPSQFRDL